jgi:hypothetical protein
MRVILNSDVLHMNRPLAKGLAGHISDFCREALQSGASLVLPGTVLLENQRHQAKLYNEAVSRLKAAASTLEEWGIAIPAFTPEDVIPNVDLFRALSATGIMIEIESAKLEDYQDAERRASLHLAPQSSETKTDEMRDLVIWAIALRLARRDGVAMLVSRDEIHSGETGLEEASLSNLHRAKSLDDALDQLGRLSPAATLARSVLAVVWNDLMNAGLALPAEVPYRKFSRLQFYTDEVGHANTKLAFEIPILTGNLIGDAHILQSSPLTVQADLKNLKLDGKQLGEGSLSVSLAGQLPTFAGPADERFAGLKSIIEGKQ